MVRPVFQVSQIPFAHDCVNLVIGRNGIGKTTLLDTLAGEIDENGNDTQSVRPNTAYITQNHGLFESLTVSEQIDIIRQIDGISGPEAAGNSADALNKLIQILEPHRKTRMGMLSGGQAQIVSVWSACMLNRELYLFDEPLSGVDPDNATLIADAITSLLPRAGSDVQQQRLQKTMQRTVVVTLHSMEQIFLFGDPWLIIVSDEGMHSAGSVEQGNMAEQAGFSTPRIRAGKASSFLTSENAHQSADIFRNLVGQE